MYTIFKSTKSVFLLSMLIISSCASPGKIDCPDFSSGKLIKGKTFKNSSRHLRLKIGNSIHKKKKIKHTKLSDPFLKDNLFIPINEISFYKKDSIENGRILKKILPTNMPVSIISIAGENVYGNAYDFKNNQIKRPINFKNHKKRIHTDESVIQRVVLDKNTDTANQYKRERKEAIIKGSAILLMAITAGISLPALGTLTASVGLIIILLLDIIISIGILKYYKKEKPKLATVTSFLRLLYSAIFAVGIGYHIAGNLSMFNKLWSLGLIGFGLHLIALGLLFNNEGGKKWVNITIKTLLILAGIGYMFLNLGILIVPNPLAFRAFIEPIILAPQILGEVLFALWMIIKGGKKSKNTTFNKNNE